MSRDRAIGLAMDELASGRLLALLKRRISYRTESRDPKRKGALEDYLREDLSCRWRDRASPARSCGIPMPRGPS